MFVLIRALTYATLFVGLLLILLPAQILSRAGIEAPGAIRAPELAGMLIAVAGGVLAIWCVLTFAFVGGGTPAPFDPPRRLVVSGPYALVRNPMYLGAGLALGGAALFYRSLALLAYAAAFFIAAHLFVVLYEEPVLGGAFGAAYVAYRRRVGRWWPHGRRGGPPGTA